MQSLAITEDKGIRVLSTQQLADGYETDKKIISNNFNRSLTSCKIFKDRKSLAGV